METIGSLTPSLCGWKGLGRSGGGSSGLVSVGRVRGGGKPVREVDLRVLRVTSGFGVRRGEVLRKVWCCYKKPEADVDPESSHISIDEDAILKKRADSVRYSLNGKCIYLIGMMGSGKSTVGRVLSKALDYKFSDSDTLVEKMVGGASVAEIFTEHSEDFFRDNESKVLSELSLMNNLVVATGGGVVVRSLNWKYMKHGITVWLDVPLEALARRIAAVGTASRPLLHQESGNVYTKALVRLHALLEERGDAYAKADAKVSLKCLAAKQGKGDVNQLTPTAIAVEALEQIEYFLVSSNLEGSKFSKSGR